jgi:hypothetical protein
MRRRGWARRRRRAFVIIRKAPTKFRQRHDVALPLVCFNVRTHCRLHLMREHDPGDDQEAQREHSHIERGRAATANGLVKGEIHGDVSITSKPAQAVLVDFSTIASAVLFLSSVV